MDLSLTTKGKNTVIKIKLMQGEKVTLIKRHYARPTEIVGLEASLFESQMIDTVDKVLTEYKYRKSKSETETKISQIR